MPGPTSQSPPAACDAPLTHVNRRHLPPLLLPLLLPLFPYFLSRRQLVARFIAFAGQGSSGWHRFEVGDSPSWSVFALFALPPLSLAPLGNPCGIPRVRLAGLAACTAQRRHDACLCSHRSRPWLFLALPGQRPILSLLGPHSRQHEDSRFLLQLLF